MLNFEISDDIRDAVCSVPESEIRAYANIQADTISIREYVNGSSNDRRRPTTPEESAIIENLIVGGILAGRNHRTNGHYMPDNIYEAASTSEFAAQAFFNADCGIDETRVNCYDTVFCPVIQWFRERGAYRF